MKFNGKLATISGDAKAELFDRNFLYVCVDIEKIKKDETRQRERGVII